MQAGAEVDRRDYHPAAPKLLEIGVSMSFCFMCREFVATMQRVYRHLTVLVMSCHGKHVAGWTLPESAPAKMKELMQKRVQDEMDDDLPSRWRWLQMYVSI